MRGPQERDLANRNLTGKFRFVGTMETNVWNKIKCSKETGFKKTTQRGMLEVRTRVKIQRIESLLRTHRAQWEQSLKAERIPRLMHLSGVQQQKVSKYLLRPQWRKPQAAKYRCCKVEAGPPLSSECLRSGRRLPSDDQFTPRVLSWGWRTLLSWLSADF